MGCKKRFCFAVVLRLFGPIVSMYNNQLDKYLMKQKIKLRAEHSDRIIVLYWNYQLYVTQGNYLQEMYFWMFSRK